jgi:hypothetical protein
MPVKALVFKTRAIPIPLQPTRVFQFFLDIARCCKAFFERSETDITESKCWLFRAIGIFAAVDIVSIHIIVGLHNPRPTMTLLTIMLLRPPAWIFPTHPDVVVTVMIAAHNDLVAVGEGVEPSCPFGRLFSRQGPYQFSYNLPNPYLLDTPIRVPHSYLGVVIRNLSRLKCSSQRYLPARGLLEVVVRMTHTPAFAKCRVTHAREPITLCHRMRFANLTERDPASNIQRLTIDPLAKGTDYRTFTVLNLQRAIF